MATLPLSGTDIRLLSGVPFFSDYKHTRYFTSKSQQEGYFLSKPLIHKVDKANYQRLDGHYYINVFEHVDNLRNVNYLMFKNSDYSSKWFYCFIENIEYVNNKNTKIKFKLDVFQTWFLDSTFKPSFIVREHCPLWNADGTPYLNTVDEGLNYGSEYENVYSYHYKPNKGLKWLVIVAMKAMDGDKKVQASVIGTPQPLTYYLIPFQNDDRAFVVRLPDTPSGDALPITSPTEVLDQLYKDEKAVNNLVSLYVTDYIGVPITYTEGNGTTPDIVTFPNNTDRFEFEHVSISDPVACIKVKKIESFDYLSAKINDDKYEGLTKSKESKLLMYPYTTLTIDDFKGSRNDYKLEYINDNILELQIKGSLGSSNKTSYGILSYNDGGNTERENISNEWALINDNPNDVPILNDYLAAFLQGNRNSINNQKSSIIFNGVINGIGTAVNAGVSAGTGNYLGAASSAMSLTQGAGNTVLELQAIQAKQQDIGNKPPQLAKMGGNTSYDVGNGYDGVFIIKKQIKSEYRIKLENFFNMYGYKLNEVKIPNFKTRRYWNYVQTKSCVISANLNNNDLQELRDIFDNGITLWHTDDIGNYSLDNEVI